MSSAPAVSDTCRSPTVAAAGAQASTSARVGRDRDRRLWCALVMRRASQEQRNLNAWTHRPRPPPRWRSGAINQLSTLTAREMIMTAITREMADCASISILAQRVTGKVSVGLKAVALVKAR